MAVFLKAYKNIEWLNGNFKPKGTRKHNKLFGKALKTNDFSKNSRIQIYSTNQLINQSTINKLAVGKNEMVRNPALDVVLNIISLKSKKNKKIESK